jgi:curved DNA-binding protein CbpA
LDIIGRAFRKRAMVCHPDRGGSAEKIQELLRARDMAYYFIGMDPP